MITKEEFDDLAEGDVIETVPIFPGLSDLPVKLTVKAKQPDQLECVATYFGVTLGKWTCVSEASGLTWRFR